MVRVFGVRVPVPPPPLKGTLMNLLQIGLLIFIGINILIIQYLVVLTKLSLREYYFTKKDLLLELIPYIPIVTWTITGIKKLIECIKELK